MGGSPGVSRDGQMSNGLNVNGSRVTTPEGCTTIFVTGCEGRRWEVFKAALASRPSEPAK